MTPMDVGSNFEPCAATASMFLYAQGTSILCLHHDTLAVERRFQRHTEQVLLVSVDNVSEHGAGRLVVSYDIGQTAIIWDLFNGDEIARFASYEHIRVASWMRNGNVAFGNSQGNVILFEPSTSEHISARTIFDPITALAPAADCRTYAIGYMNGSILIAALQPSFTILHTLTTTRSPSPIVTLAWHASSSKQKSDMLATQTLDSDLRVWSVAKPPGNETPKVVRILKKSENHESGLNWLAWSKNGRIIQFSQGETSAWDVRTKNVTYEPIPTLDGVAALAIYGPTATLFTLGRNSTIQQFDLNPPTLVANVQHLPIIPPPTPPVDSVEEPKQQGHATAPISNVPVQHGSESEEDTMAMSPLHRIAEELNQIEEQRQERSANHSPLSSPARSRTGSVSSRSSKGHYNRSNASVSSRVTTKSSNATMFSTGSSSIPYGSEGFSTGHSTPSIASSQRSRPRGSRLRQEVLRSPEDAKKIVDLFKYTKGRLSDVPYRTPTPFDPSRLTPNDLRRQMLSVVFGWDGDIQGLIRDELSRQTPGSASAVLLAKWIGEVDTDMMASLVGSDTMSSSDWMCLALSQIGGPGSTKKVGHAFVERLLAKGDVHAAATILLGLGDQNDAVEVYVSRGYYMEAVLLTCLVFPADWQRQSHLVRKWGEFAVQHNQHQLAIRCLSCTGIESAETWTSPRAAMFGQQGQGQGQGQSISRTLSPPMSPPAPQQANASRMTTKNSALKLITSFGAKGSGDAGQTKFFGLGSDDRTPMGGAGVTPIADSAISPGGAASFLRPTTRGGTNPSSARTATPGGFARQRLPSIGETPVDDTPLPLKPPVALPTPADSGSDKEKDHHVQTPGTHERKVSGSGSSEPTLLLSSARYEPNRAGTKSPMSQVRTPTLPSPAQDAFTVSKEKSRTRNGSRDRKPDGLQIQWPPMESIITGDYMSSAGDSASSRYRHQRSSTMSSLHSASSLPTRMETKTPPLTGKSLESAQSPMVTGKSIDKYISSLEEANYHARQQREESRRHESGHETQHHRKPSDDDDAASRGRSRPRVREPSVGNREGTGVRYIKPAKRSPSSPVPMSPEDVNEFLSNGTYQDERYYGVSSPVESQSGRNRSNRRTATSKSRGESKLSERSNRTARRTSPERKPGSRVGSKPSSKNASRVGSRATSRRRSPDAREEINSRGRSHIRTEGSTIRSPSSPLPMSAQAKLYQEDEDDEAELRAVAEERQRFRSRQRSTSRRPQERGKSGIREASPEGRRPREGRSRSRQAHERGTSSRRQISTDRRPLRDPSESRHPTEPRSAGPTTDSARTLVKELAARELEERRLSLARRPSAPAIPHPGELSAGRPPIESRSKTELGNSPASWRTPGSGFAGASTQSKSGSPESAGSGTHVSGTNTSSVTIGLPATPRAMRHPKYMGSDPNERDKGPAFPQIPDQRENRGPGNTSPYSQRAEKQWALPNTLYSAQYSQGPPRSVSAPIPEEPRSPHAPTSPPPLPAALPTHPAFQYAVPPSSRRRNPSPGGDRSNPRKVAPGMNQPGTLGYKSPPPVLISIDEAIQASAPVIDIHNNDKKPAPPPPPPLLPELQHLSGPTSPPPPPPPPSIFKPGHTYTNSGSSGSAVGVINIGIDDGSRGGTPAITPVIEVPPPPSTSSHSHRRGRSVNENLSSRIRGVTDRMRSTSRSRINKSPPVEHHNNPSPYESVPPLWTEQPVRGNSSGTYTGEKHPREVRAGMTPEQVRTGFIPVDGGMI
ncbi:MAG: hypothetical protein M1836_007557 [Candelina mexicana]|nr:MAG: hypothetical protein M1836_007557 [Candelina mexicana]